MNEIKKKVMQRADLAPEAVGCTRMIVIDNTNIFLENHKGVREYSQKRIHLDIGDNDLVIEGQELTLDGFGKESVSVRGEIDIIRFERSNNKGQTKR